MSSVGPHRHLASMTLIIVAALCSVVFATPAHAGYYAVAPWVPVKTLSEPADVAVALDGTVYVADAQGRRVVALSTGGSFLNEFDGSEVFGGELVRPNAIAIGPDGRIYVADRGGDRIVVFDASGVFVRSWGSRGSGSGQFNAPSDLCFGPSGEIYVADTFNSRVQVFDQNGVLLRTILGETTAVLSTRLSTPVGVAVYNSELYVADVNNLKVSVMTLTGGSRRVIGLTESGSATTSRYLRPAGVEVDPSGSILVIDAGRHVIEKCSTAGVVQATWGGTGVLAQPDGVVPLAGGVYLVADTMANRVVRIVPATSPTPVHFAPLPGEVPTASGPKGVEVESSGSYLVAEAAANRVVRYGAAGNLLTTFAPPSGPAMSAPGDVAVSASGAEIYVCDTGNHRVLVYDSSGSFVRTLGTFGAGEGQFSSPAALAVMPSGELVVADTGNSRVQIIRPDGGHVVSIGASVLRNPGGVAVAGDGTVYVSDSGNHRIVVFNSTGARLRQMGAYGSTAGSLISPAGVALTGTGHIAVADRGNHRIQWFTLGGTPADVFGARGSGPGEFFDPWGVAATSGAGVLVGDTGNNRLGRLGFDGVAPVTVADGDVTDWVNRDATVVLTASDSGIGVATTSYRIGAGAQTLYQGPFTIAAEGETTVTFWSADKAGNVETPKTALVRIDRTPPIGTTQFGTGAAVIKTGDIAVLSFVSGATEMRLSRTGFTGAWVPYAGSSTLAVPAEGAVRLTAEYRDAAGNTLTNSFDCLVDGTGPVTTISRTPVSAIATGTVTIDVVATDVFSPVTSIRYRVDGGAERPYTGPFAVSGDGLHTVEAWAIDAPGNVGARTSSSFGISRLPLGGVLSIAGGRAYVGYRTVEASTTIQGATQMQWDAGLGFSAWQPFTPTFWPTFSGDGVRVLTVRFRDLTGTVVEQSGSVNIDTARPVTTLSGPPPSGVSGTPVIVLLTVEDAAPSTSYYSLDGGPAQRYSGPFTVTGDREHTVTYHSVDEAGNAEDPRTASFTIAATPPAGTMSPAGGRAIVSTTTVVLALDVPSARQMRFDTGGGFGPWSPYAPSATVRMPGEGVWWVTGNFANVADVRSELLAQIIVDQTPPVIELTGAPPTGVTAQDVTLQVAARDGLTGIESVMYRVDGGAARRYSDGIRVTTAGRHRVEAWAVDGAGNSSAPVSATFAISDMLRQGGSLVVASGAATVGTLTVPVSARVTGAVEMSVDHGTGYGGWVPYASSFGVTFPRGGTNVAGVLFRDVYGAVLELRDSVIVDMDPPVTVVYGVPATGLSFGPVLLGFVVTDVSRVAVTEYSLDGGSVRAYTGPVLVTGAGPHAVTYRSVDSLGHTEATTTVAFTIGSDIGAGSLRIAGGRSYVNTVTVGVDCLVSGAVAMRFDSGDGPGPWMPFAPTAKVTLQGEGIHDIAAAFRSSTGVETTLNAPVLVDLTRPAVTGLTPSVKSVSFLRNGSARYSVSMTARASDEGTLSSSVSGWQWRLGGMVRSARGAYVFPGVPSGRYLASAIALDRAGNRGVQTGSVRLAASRAPVVPASARAGRPIAVRGSIPVAGAGSVQRLACYRRAANGVWVLSKNVTLRTRVVRGTATVSARVALSRGSWRIVSTSSRGSALNASAPSRIVSVR